MVRRRFVKFRITGFYAGNASCFLKKSSCLMAVALFAHPCNFFAKEGTQVLLGFSPSFVKPIGSDIKYGYGLDGKLTIRPITHLDFFVSGEYLNLAMNGIDSLNVMDFAVGSGFNFPLTDRVALNTSVQIGMYRAYTPLDEISGINAGIGIGISYKINPIVGTVSTMKLSHYAATPRAFMTNAGITPGIELNLTQALSRKSYVDMEPKELFPVFPVLYSWYEKNSFGNVIVTNNENATITDVTVEFFQPQFMNQPNKCAKFHEIGKGESVEVPLTAFFNEHMLELTEEVQSVSSVRIEYQYLGMKKTNEISISVPVCNKNAMSWEDDRRAAAFVSARDPAAMWFSKYVTSVVRENMKGEIPLNVQYAMGIFEALNQFGLNYVIDPSSSYSDNLGGTTIDFLQFPYQTLMYRGGDCDDISILVSSLFEAVGINTAFVTIPGHIFMAFDSGMRPRDVEAKYEDKSGFIIRDDHVWMPLEITICDEGFYKAWRVGSREWNVAASNNQEGFFPMHESWKTYKPVSVPGAASKFTLPERQLVADAYTSRLDEWIIREIKPLVAAFEDEIRRTDSNDVRNRLGILYGQYGIFDKAEEQFRILRNRGYADSFVNTANLLYVKKQYESALELYASMYERNDDNSIACLGAARCAYELGDFNLCDKYYKNLKKNDNALALEYSYLGSFQSTKGRAYNLSDRLRYSKWASGDYSGVFEGDLTEHYIAELVPVTEDENKTASGFVRKIPLGETVSIDDKRIAAVFPAEKVHDDENESDDDEKISGAGSNPPDGPSSGRHDFSGKNSFGGNGFDNGKYVSMEKTSGEKNDAVLYGMNRDSEMPRPYKSALTENPASENAAGSHASPAFGTPRNLGNVEKAIAASFGNSAKNIVNAQRTAVPSVESSERFATPTYEKTLVDDGDQSAPSSSAFLEKMSSSKEVAFASRENNVSDDIAWETGHVHDDGFDVAVSGEPSIVQENKILIAKIMEMNRESGSSTASSLPAASSVPSVPENEILGETENVRDDAFDGSVNEKPSIVQENKILIAKIIEMKGDVDSSNVSAPAASASALDSVSYGRAESLGHSVNAEIPAPVAFVKDMERKALESERDEMAASSENFLGSDDLISVGKAMSPVLATKSDFKAEKGGVKNEEKSHDAENERVLINPIVVLHRIHVNAMQNRKNEYMIKSNAGTGFARYVYGTFAFAFGFLLLIFARRKNKNEKTC